MSKTSLAHPLKHATMPDLNKMKPSIQHDRLLDCAINAARTAGEYALRNYGRRKEVVSVSEHDVKLRLDLECQEQAESVIHEQFPDHALLGEESAKSDEAQQVEADYLWIVDPIDGTVNFTHGLRHWCCSVAVQREGSTVAGAVFAPALEELYTASAERPALLNEEPIRVSTVDDLAAAMVLTGMDRNLDPNLPPYTMFTRLASGTQKARILGSAALDMCQVACGRVEGYFECGIYIWDVAAAGLIVNRAGGKARILQRLGRGRLVFLATNGHVDGALRRLVTENR